MDRLVRCAGAVSVMCLSGMVLILIATLVLRPFGILVPSSEIITTYLMVGMAFFGLVYAYAGGAHVRVDALYRHLPAGLRRGVDVLSHVGAAALCGAIAWHSGSLAWMAFVYHDLSDGLIAIPMWLPMSPVALGFGLFALALLRDGVRVLRGQPVCFAVSEKDDAAALATAGSKETP